MAVLRGMSGETAGQTIELDEREVTLGRNQECTISLDDPAVSGTHCSITGKGHVFTLRDHGSTNGTRLNSRTVNEVILKPKDILQVGSVEFMFDAEHAGDVDVESDLGAPMEVEVAPGPAAAPKSFNTISPFGAQTKDRSKSLWYALITLIGLMALGAVVFLFIKLVTG